MRFLFKLFLVFFVLFLHSCKDKISTNPYYSFFYPYQQEAKVYVYRDVKQGLNEKFNRVYGIEDSYGKHIVVENYSMDGRITDAMNYNLDSLDMMDMMVVDKQGKKQKANISKKGFFPMYENQVTHFLSQFPGFTDSTVILYEVIRKIDNGTPIKTKVLGRNENTITVLDTIRMTQVNPHTKKQQQVFSVFKSYFSEGIGLVRIHDIHLKSDYQLEKIISQQEFIQWLQK
ncbi:MAG: hypothetical protein HYU67_12970 [Flavobacteriia bacterium]|nr:hypothetical protein [Flavobacteriia bacterium]